MCYSIDHQSGMSPLPAEATTTDLYQRIFVQLINQFIDPSGAEGIIKNFEGYFMSKPLVQLLE